MIAFIYVGIDFQSVVSSGSLHELPQSGGSGRGACDGVEVAFYYHQIFKVIRDSVFLQYGFYDREIAVGFLYHLQGGAVHIGKCQQFAIHTLMTVVSAEVYRFSTENDTDRHFGTAVFQCGDT